jgi:hypothetical protein
LFSFNQQAAHSICPDTWGYMYISLSVNLLYAIGSPPFIVYSFGYFGYDYYGYCDTEEQQPSI